MKVRKILLCMLLSALLLVGASAATWQEMQENGAVSDDGIRLGDVRDGIVSDVSEPMDDGILGDIVTDVSDALGDMMDGTDGSGGTDHILGPMTPETTSAPSTSAPTTTANNAAGGEDGGMSMGVVIAILVVIAVIAIIFMLLPKRK